MTSRRTRLLALMIVCAASTTLTGCITVQTEPSEPNTVQTAPTDTSTGRDGDGDADAVVRGDTDCEGRDITVSESEAEYRLLGVCPTVTIEGTDMNLDLTQAQTGTVIVRGDRNEIEAGDLTSVDIDGQTNEFELASLGSLSIAGDRNEVDVEGILGSVTVNGNENDVESLELGDVSDNGDRNEIRTD